MKVLYVASNPADASNLGLEREITDFQKNAVAASGDPVQFIFLPNLSFEQLAAQISVHKPDILHISAHGDGEGLSLAHEGHEHVLLSADMLCEFLDVDPPPQLVYLNACNSAPLAQELIRRVPMAIGTTAPITNKAARAAALTFYMRILEGRSVGQAFRNGRMIMKGLDRAQVTSELFQRPGLEPDKCILHVPTRIIARFHEDKFRPTGDEYLTDVGLSGCTRNTIQVVFFTDDETFISNEGSLAEELCVVARSTPIEGHVWIDVSRPVRGNFRLFACGVTAGGDHFSVSGDLCSALERHYVISHGVSMPTDLPAYIQGTIATLRRKGRR